MQQQMQRAESAARPTAQRLVESHSVSLQRQRDAGSVPGLSMSRSLPPGQIMAGIRDPTAIGVNVDSSDHAEMRDQVDGPSNPSSIAFAALPARREVSSLRSQRPNKSMRMDPRCDPTSRFFEPPNVDHLHQG